MFAFFIPSSFLSFFLLVFISFLALNFPSLWFITFPFIIFFPYSFFHFSFSPSPSVPCTAFLLLLISPSPDPDTSWELSFNGFKADFTVFPLLFFSYLLRRGRGCWSDWQSAPVVAAATTGRRKLAEGPWRDPTKVQLNIFSASHTD